MNKMKCFALVCVLAVGALGGLAGEARAQGARHYYSPKYQAKGYSYRYYYYKPYGGYQGYRYHVAVYYPQRPRYVYYYNPYTRKYWGRCDLNAKGYSKLAPGAQAGKLNDICKGNFPQPGPMPAMPESTDGTTMLPPPEMLNG